VFRGSVETLVLWGVLLVVYRVASGMLSVAERKQRLTVPVVFSIRRILRWIAMMLALLLALQAFGVLQHAWAAITAVTALVAIGFVAVWSVLSNTLCSLLLMISRPFEIGDTVEIAPDALRGRVVNFTLLFTTLRREDGTLIQVPNNLFFQRVIVRQRGQQTIGLHEQLSREQDATD
jgi:small-conductance mechanosensitive channel